LLFVQCSSTNGIDKECVQGSDEKTTRKDTTVKPRYRCDNIEIGRKGIEWGFVGHIYLAEDKSPVVD
jgi:hypothetical protein